MQNELYKSDCLDLSKKLYAERGEFVDLIYIDPPFNSLKDRYMNSTDKEKAFIDTWNKIPYTQHLEEINSVNPDLSALIIMITSNDNDLSYLTNIGIRIYYQHKILKQTGSFYLHCDPSMSHYLKIICDFIFGKENFKNEIVWERTSGARSSKAMANKFPQNHDIILFYSKSKHYKFRKLYFPYDEEYIKRKFVENDNDGRGPYRFQVLATYSKKRLEELQKENRVRKGANAKNYEFKQYLSDSKGVRISDLWTKGNGVNNLNSTDKNLGTYPTQKPIELIERILDSSAEPRDILFDGFCGSGSSLMAAQRKNLQWIGTDINITALDITKDRLDKIGYIDYDFISL